MPELEVKISLESVISDALIQFAQTVMEQNGVRIDSVRFNWGSDSQVVLEANVNTTRNSKRTFQSQIRDY